MRTSALSKLPGTGTEPDIALGLDADGTALVPMSYARVLVPGEIPIPRLVDLETTFEGFDSDATPGTDPPVEIRNQARVPLWYKDKFGRDYPPLPDCKTAIDRFACTTHCVGARLIDDNLDIYAPFGLNEIFSMRLTPNLELQNRETQEAKARRQSALWPELTVISWPEEEG